MTKPCSFSSLRRHAAVWQPRRAADTARLGRARSCWAPAPGLDSGLACAVSRRAVRGGADPALRAPPRETDKVYTWFAIGVQEAEKVCSKFIGRFAYSGKKFTLGLQLVCRKQEKVCSKFTCQFAYSGKKFTLGLHLVCTWFTGSRKVHLSICVQWQKFTLLPKCLHQKIPNSRKSLHYCRISLHFSQISLHFDKISLHFGKISLHFDPKKFAFWSISLQHLSKNCRKVYITQTLQTW